MVAGGSFIVIIHYADADYRDDGSLRCYHCFDDWGHDHVYCYHYCQAGITTVVQYEYVVYLLSR